MATYPLIEDARPARTPPPTFLFLPMHLSKSPVGPRGTNSSADTPFRVTNRQTIRAVTFVAAWQAWLPWITDRQVVAPCVGVPSSFRYIGGRRFRCQQRSGKNSSSFSRPTAARRNPVGRSNLYGYAQGSSQAAPTGRGPAPSTALSAYAKPGYGTIPYMGDQPGGLGTSWRSGGSLPMGAPKWLCSRKVPAGADAANEPHSSPHRPVTRGVRFGSIPRARAAGTTA
jgi:hypothetical protein